MGGIVYGEIQCVLRLREKAADFRDENIVADRLGGADAQRGF